MLLNLSNHEAARWSAAQQQAVVERFDDVHDLPFPSIDPNADLASVIALAQKYIAQCRDLLKSTDPLRSAIHVMGEMTFVYQFVKLAAAAGLRCVASTTERIAVNHPDGAKTSEFRFLRFRNYDTQN
jgi:hypothetical protein